MEKLSAVSTYLLASVGKGSKRVGELHTGQASDYFAILEHPG